MRVRRAGLTAGLALLAVLSSAAARADDDRCGAGKDLVVQALERVRPTSPDDSFEDALELLKHAVSTCAELGDAWYYRSLVEQRLGNARMAQYSLGKAQTFGSEAMREALNPFVLATPSSRGLHGGAPEGGEPPAHPPSAAGPVQQKWALVIGIGQFQDPAIPTLHYTTADAKAFALELADPAIGRFPPDHVGVLLDDQATTKNIKEKLNWIARNAQPNDLVVIYVATHGSPRTDDSAGGANYIVTYDTDIGQAKRHRPGCAVRDGASHGGSGERGGYADESAADRGDSGHLLQRRGGEQRREADGGGAGQRGAILGDAGADGRRDRAHRDRGGAVG